MCGIYGIIDLNGSENSDTSELIAMMQESQYRGPDSHKTYINNHIKIGFNRLSIIDLDKRSDQPFVSYELGLAIVFNGEIYNYLEIKSDLINLGYSFITESDTEVLLTAYYHHKKDCFSMFNGMWSLAIYDFNHNEITLSRDRLGIKPLYYMIQNDNFYFASEMKSLLKVKSTRKNNQESIHQFLIHGVNSFANCETLVDGIYEFKPGNFAKLEEGTLKYEAYFTLPEIDFDQSDTQIIEKVKNLFSSAVQLRLRSDVPIALMLSAGLDSSAIAFQIDQLIENKEINIQKIDAFTLNFSGFKNNEWEAVKENSKLLKHVKCQAIEISIDEFKTYINKTISEFDIPTLSVSHILHAFALEKIKFLGFTVILNGQGPDEVFGGYFPKDIGSLLLDIFQQSPNTGFQEMKAIKRNWKISILQQIRLICQNIIIRRFPFVLHIGKAIEKSKITGILSYKLNKKSKIQSNYDFNSKIQIIDKKFNGILQYEDMASMLNSMEMRSPFLDYRLLTLGVSLPSNYKLRDGHSKWILRKAFENLLPPEINWASWKLGYAVPKTVLMANILPTNHKTDEKSLNDFWRKYNLEVWLKHHNIQ